jgi:hypothetical protein
VVAFELQRKDILWEFTGIIWTGQRVENICDNQRELQNYILPVQKYLVNGKIIVNY